MAPTATGLDVPFFGEDGRSTVFRVGRLPLRGWHAPLAEAFAERVGPAGTRRTLSSATGSWGVLGRFVRFLASLPKRPTGRGVLHEHRDLHGGEPDRSRRRPHGS